MGAVIALFEGQKFGPGRLAAQFVVLSGQAQGGFDAVAAARGVEGAGHAVGGEEIAQNLRQFDYGVVGGAAKGRVIGQTIKLIGDGAFHRLAGKSEVDVPQATDCIDDLVPVDVGDTHALRMRDDGRGMRLHFGRMRHGMPQ